MFEFDSFDSHEKVVHVCDVKSGLRAIIAIHSTARGPAAGGCRLWSYESTSLALNDALRLSRGMSYKNALADLALGGGKSVILGPVSPECRKEQLKAFGDAVNALAGRYITAEDVGVGVPDMEIISTRTPFVSGLTDAGGAGGNPSPYTARGVRLGIEAVAQRTFGRGDIANLKVAVQGLGGVGGNLVRELAARGARLVVADIDPARVERACDEYSAEPASIDDILLSDVDIVAPCALGAVITESVARQLRARAVAGGANNQLATPNVGQLLHDRGITYAPDYLINAGGIIMVAAEYFAENSAERVNADVDKIHNRTLDVLDRAKAENLPTDVIADRMARDAIANRCSSTQAVAAETAAQV